MTCCFFGRVRAGSRHTVDSLARRGDECVGDSNVLHGTHPGDMLYFHSYRRPGLVIDLVQDIRGINDEVAPEQKHTTALLSHIATHGPVSLMYTLQ